MVFLMVFFKSIIVYFLYKYNKFLNIITEAV
jgi:hypothetical protein